MSGSRLRSARATTGASAPSYTMPGADAMAEGQGGYMAILLRVELQFEYRLLTRCDRFLLRSNHGGNVPESGISTTCETQCPSAPRPYSNFVRYRASPPVPTVWSAPCHWDT